MADEAGIFYGWHWLRNSKRLGYGDRRLVRQGETLEMKGRRGNEKPVVCGSGMHASKLITDALAYARGDIVCRVAVWGDVRHGYDKICGRSRHVLWMINAREVLRRWGGDVITFGLAHSAQAGLDPGKVWYRPLVRSGGLFRPKDRPQRSGSRSVGGPSVPLSEYAYNISAAVVNDVVRVRCGRFCDKDGGTWGSVWGLFDDWLEEACIEEAKRLGVWCEDRDLRQGEDR